MMGLNNLPEDMTYGKLIQNLEDQIGRLAKAPQTLHIPPITIVANYTVQEADEFIIVNKPASVCVITLLDPVAYIGWALNLSCWSAYGVQSLTSNVVPLLGGPPSALILPSTGGKWCVLKSDGTNWIIVRSN